MEPWYMETWTETCGPYPGGLVLTHTHLKTHLFLGGIFCESLPLKEFNKPTGTGLWDPGVSPSACVIQGNLPFTDQPLSPFCCTEVDSMSHSPDSVLYSPLECFLSYFSCSRAPPICYAVFPNQI